MISWLFTSNIGRRIIWQYVNVTMGRVTMGVINVIIVYVYMLTMVEVESTEERKHRCKRWNRMNQTWERLANKISAYIGTRKEKKNRGSIRLNKAMRMIAITGALLSRKGARDRQVTMSKEILIKNMMLMSSQTQDDRWVNELDLDESSGRIGIDNRASACISHSLDDFTGPMTEVHRTIKGFGGTRTMGTKMGTIVWRWMDDQGRVHRHAIPNSYYIPEGKMRLLSPQHWAQTGRKRSTCRLRPRTTR